jgi:23S rRNA (adenine-N6)-dimethyltransferase
VIAVEKDPALITTLRQRFGNNTAPVTVWGQDILEVHLPCRPYKVFANVPFDATAAIIHHLTSSAEDADDPPGTRCRP